MFAHAPNTRQLELKNRQGDIYRIQVAWPLAWDTPNGSDHSASIMYVNHEVKRIRYISWAHNSYLSYILDGNALFFTAAEASRRSAVLSTSDHAIVVGVGYPIEDTPYSPRRYYDYTPPSDTYVAPSGIDGQQQVWSHSGATEFLEVLVGTVRPALLSDLFPGLRITKEILMGHSLGGLCTLHALFENRSELERRKMSGSESFGAAKENERQCRCSSRSSSEDRSFEKIAGKGI
ncbi:uncharacterized protein ATNIH1004_009648 [Aspergillus tanneri]|uniref:Uncharacterized protein n=1 Tax=Aspergillus tanneri TaxID=1220188 RepID=A0A5M9MJ89_9EURO|nr:uncharacterized protein ATNIH1004_009648 [Aspergillus tanneri]KAA8642887.1 hypothetical protein ATNIH1004_009648 [Aspergillus tanneri]